MPANSIYFRGLLTILCWLMLSSVCSSQTYSLQHAFYTYYTQEDGLGNGVLSDIVQDQTGFIWVGTFNGLFRFDGTEFQAFLHDPSDSTSISHNQIKELSVGPDNRLWIATDGGGLNVFDPSTEQFKSWIIDSGKPGSQPQPRSQTVLVDKKGRVWVGTEDEGFCRLNEAENTFDCFEVVPGKDYPFNVVLAFAEDPQDEDLLWVSNGRYLVQFSHSKEAITWHLPIIDVLDRVDVFDDLFVDSNRTLWVRTYDSGLFQLDIETGKTQVHFPDVPELETRPTFFYIKDIHPKDEEEIWVATHNYGLGTFHKETQQFNFINTDTEGENLFAFNARSLWLDKDNRLWVGYEDRVEVIDPYKQIFRHFSLPGEFHVDPSNVFMCNFNNLNDQIIISGRATTAVLYFKEAFSDYSVKRIIHPNGYPILHNYEVFPYQDDTWLFAERDLPKIGLLTFNPNYPAKDIPARFVEPEEEFRDRISRKMVRDQAGYLWALQYDILKIDLEQDTFIRYPNYLREELGPNWNRSLSSLFIDSRDQLWVGSELGPRVFNTTDFERVAVPSWTDEPLNGNEIYEFAEDHQGRIWMNTAQQGIRIYDPNAKDVDPYTHLRMKDGLPSDQMYNILVDLNGDIWSSTAGGLCRIDSETLRITTFTSQEGLKRNDLGYLWRSAMQQLDNGSICIGNFGGFTWFHPDSIPINHNPPPIVFTGFKVFDRDYQLDKNLNYLDKIELEHQQNFFQFQFAALNYTDPNNNTYQYQLEGYDADWRTSNEGVASYTGVQGGNYTFRVKASNNHGVWNAEGIAIQIYVRPPFWRTWWFLFLSGIVIAGILGLIYWSRVQIIKKEEGLKTAFNKQLAEVEMSALRAQMNPHFLFNCMNSINLFILKNDTEAASDYLTKFSRLIRLILNNSKAKSIPLSKEIDALDLYVQMEQLRFTQQFDYVLDLAPDIGAEQVHIPPMILQPYVENAIWHGLMNKEGKGRLRLSIKLMDEHLYCEIEDNGIGREAALKQKERAAKTRASVGMKITKTRMDLTHQLYQIQGGVEIVDLYDKDSKPRGTLVKLKIPKLIPESYESINR